MTAQEKSADIQQLILFIQPVVKLKPSHLPDRETKTRTCLVGGSAKKTNTKNLNKHRFDE